MEIVHNRCEFADKQLLRVQEAPESIPDGETPQTIDIFAFDDLVDVARPGDRVVITGIYRAVCRALPHDRDDRDGSGDGDGNSDGDGKW